MGLTLSQYETFMENTEQVITARNVEEYLIENPEAEYPPPPDPTYSEWLTTGHAQMAECLASGDVHAAILTTGTSGGDLGLATLTYPEMTTPVVVVSVVDAVENNTFYQVVLQSVGSTDAVVRVTQNTSTVVLGFSLLTLPTLAAGATVHVMAYDAG